MRFDLRAAISDLDDTWEVALIGKNVSNKLVSGFSGQQPVILDGSNRIEAAEAPRTLSVQAQYKF